MRKSLIAVALSCLMVIGASPIPVHAVMIQSLDGEKVEIPEFYDCRNHWAKTQINQWQYYKLIEGVKDDKTQVRYFKPNDNISRRDFAVIVDKLFKYKKIAANSFKDLEMSQYYTEPILRLHAAGVMNGSGTLMRPHDNITREEASVMIVNSFKMDKDYGNTKFADDASISSWAKPYVRALQDSGYIKGTPDGKFNPKGNLTRAEAITIIDNIIRAYYTNAVEGTGTEYTNSYAGNGLANGNSLALESSNIVGNLYMTPGASGGLKLNYTSIDGTIVVMSDSLEITAKESDIQRAEIYGVGGSITGGDSFEEIIIKSSSNEGYKISGVPYRLTLEGNTYCEIEGVEFKNTHKNKVTYKKQAIIDEVASKNGAIEGGPNITMGKVIQSVHNDIKITGIKLVKSGDSDIKEVGVIYNKSSDVPTYNEHDKLKEFDGNEAEMLDFNLDMPDISEGETWTYRAYAVNKNGKIGYGEPVAIKGYDYDVTSKITKVDYIKDSDGSIKSIQKTFEIRVYGDNVPTIANVYALSNNTNAISSALETSMSLSETTKDDDYQSYKYRYTFTYGVDDEGSVKVDNYFGYRIKYNSTGDSEGYTEEKFPTVTENTTLPTDIEYIQTGEGEYSEGSTIIVNNKYKENSGVKVLETGVASLTVSIMSPEPTSVTANWQKYPYYTGTTTNSRVFDILIDTSEQNNMRTYYAAYVRTANKITYGEIKSFVSPTAPIVKNLDVVSGTTSVVVNIKLESYGELNKSDHGYGIVYVKNLNTNEVISEYSEISLDKVGATYNKETEMLKIPLTGLQPQSTYEVKINPTNTVGSTSYVFEIKTN